LPIRDEDKIGLLDVTKDSLLIIEFIKYIDPSSLKVSLRIGVDNKLLEVLRIDNTYKTNRFKMPFF